MNAHYGNTNEVCVDTAPQRMIDRAGLAFGSAIELCERVENIVGALLGAVPTAGNVSKGPDKADGRLGVLANGADTVQERVRRAHDALSRLESAL